MAEKLSFDILLGRDTLKAGLQENAKEAKALEDTLITAQESSLGILPQRALRF